MNKKFLIQIIALLALVGLPPGRAQAEPIGAPVISAQYGAGNTWADVTDKLNQLFAQQGGNVVIPASGGAMNALFGDSMPGATKVLRVKYKVGDGRIVDLSAGENDGFGLAQAAGAALDNLARAALQSGMKDKMLQLPATPAGQQLTYGSVIRLKHQQTQKYLTGLGMKLVTGSKLWAIACNSEGVQGTQPVHMQWLVEAGVAGGDVANSVQVGKPVNQNDIISLKSMAFNYHAHSSGSPSPVSGQGEVCGFEPGWGKNGQGDMNDNWKVLDNPVNGAVIRLKEGFQPRGWNLHSHPVGDNQFILGNRDHQEVTTFSSGDANDNWILEIITLAQPTAVVAPAPVVATSAPTPAPVAVVAPVVGTGASLKYGTLVTVDSDSFKTNISPFSNRLWIHGEHRLALSSNKPARPNQDHEGLVGVNSSGQDSRYRRGPQVFSLIPAPGYTGDGQIRYGDKMILVAYVGSKYGTYDQINTPEPRYAVVIPDSRHAAGQPDIHYEFAFKTLDNQQAMTDAAYLTLTSPASKTGVVTDSDVVNINSAKYNRLAWTFESTRWSAETGEILFTDLSKVNDQARTKIQAQSGFRIKPLNETELDEVGKANLPKIQAVMVKVTTAALAAPAPVVSVAAQAEPRHEYERHDKGRPEGKEKWMHERKDRKHEHEKAYEPVVDVAMRKLLQEQERLLHTRVVSAYDGSQDNTVKVINDLLSNRKISIPAGRQTPTQITLSTVHKMIVDEADGLELSLETAQTPRAPTTIAPVVAAKN